MELHYSWGKLSAECLLLGYDLSSLLRALIGYCATLAMSKRTSGRGTGNKFRVTMALPVTAVMNCADNTGAKNLFIIAVKGIHGRLNKLPSASVGSMVLATVKKGKPELRKKVWIHACQRNLIGVVSLHTDAHGYNYHTGHSRYCCAPEEALEKEGWNIHLF